jgi:hypothetical protein
MMVSMMVPNVFMDYYRLIDFDSLMYYFGLRMFQKPAWLISWADILTQGWIKTQS